MLFAVLPITSLGWSSVDFLRYQQRIARDPVPRVADERYLLAGNVEDCVVAATDTVSDCWAVDPIVWRRPDETLEPQHVVENLLVRGPRYFGIFKVRVGHTAEIERRGGSWVGLGGTRTTADLITALADRTEPVGITATPDLSVQDFVDLCSRTRPPCLLVPSTQAP